MTPAAIPAEKKAGPRRGRPRSEKARVAILAATSAILQEKGLRGMGVDDVAARAGVSKATIYRWWDSKAELALDTFLADVRQRLSLPDTGSLAGDLRARVRSVVKAYSRPPVRPVLTGLIAEAQFDPEFAAALREHVIGPLRESSREIFRRALARGEIAEETPVDLALDMVVGAIYYRLLLKTAPVDTRLADGAVDLILAALTARRQVVGMGGAQSPQNRCSRHGSPYR